MAVVAFPAALIIGILAYPILVSTLARANARQHVAAYGPQTHLIKEGTPTMGGVLFVVLMLVAWGSLAGNRLGFVSAFAIAAGAAIGMLDDVANSRGRGLGLTAVQKLALEVVVGITVGIGMYTVGATHQFFPGFGSLYLGGALIPLVALAIVAGSNATNLTDGVDGLAASCALVAFAALAVIGWHENDMAAVAISAAACGGLLAFLLYNWFPARVFMGDTGSLALGCGLVAVGTELHLLWLLPLLGIVFVAETLSVIINVTAIRRFHRRVFRASPLHHHFEALGLREQRLVALFASVATLAALATVAIAFTGGVR